MRYSDTVTKEDATEAVRLLKVATQAAATDPRTGRIDMDMINTGRTTVDREMEESLHIGLREYLAEVSFLSASITMFTIFFKYSHLDF